MKSKRKCLLILSAASLAVVTVLAFLMRGDRPAKEESRMDNAPLRSRRIKEVKMSAQERFARIDAAHTRPAEKPNLKSDLDEELSAAAKKLSDDIQKALDDEDFAEIQNIIENVIKSRDLLLIKKAIAAASWFGPKALPELTGLAAALSGMSSKGRQGSGASSGGAWADGQGLVDAGSGDAGSGDSGSGEAGGEEFDDEVTDALFEAMSAIEEKLTEIEDPVDKASIIAEYMKSSTSDKTQILLSGQLKTILDEAIVLDAVIDIIENGGNQAAVAAAREVYEFETGGDQYTGVDAAQRWLDENYVPPEE